MKAVTVFRHLKRIPGNRSPGRIAE